MSQIKPEYVNLLLSEELIKDYLVQIAPIDFKAPFKTSLFFSSLEKSNEKIKNNVRIPIIAGGLIDHKDEAIKALSLGASAISTGKKELWG